MHIFFTFFLLVLPSTTLSSQISQQWTTCYQKKIVDHDYRGNAIEFMRTAKTPFKQLLFCWNAFRPTQGFFSFFVQARNAATKKWGPWHMMADWGKHIQQSYEDKRSSGHTEFCYVRLEHTGAAQSDAFRIKAIAQDGADICLIKRFSVCVSTNEDLVAETPQSLPHLATIQPLAVPMICQYKLDHPRASDMCSPTSCTMLLSYLLKTNLNPLHVAENIYDTGLQVYGSWPFNMAHAFDATKGTYWFTVLRLRSFATLHELLAAGMPVVVSVRGFLPDAPKIYSHGHLLVVVGYDAQSKEVICNDPAVQTVRQRYPLSAFLAAWEKSHRLSYVAQSVV